MVPVQGTPAMKPILSPDGSQLVYGTVREGKTGLKLRDLATGIERWLAYDVDRNQLEGRATRDVLPNVAFSPDGRWLFAAYGGKIHRLGVQDGSEAEIPFTAEVSLEVTPTLRFPHHVETGPVRARRVQQVAVARDGRVSFSAMGRIWVADAGGGSPSRLTRTPRAREFMPSWSPDGRWVAFVTWDEEGGALWKARSDGRGEPVRLSAGPAFWVDPAWTPDGASVVALTAPLASTLAAPPGGLPADAQLAVVPADGGPAAAGSAVHGSAAPPLRHVGRRRERIPRLAPGPAGLVSVGLAAGDVRVEARLPQAAARGSELRMSPAGDAVAVRMGPRLVRIAVDAGGRGAPGAGPRRGRDPSPTGTPRTGRGPPTARRWPG